MKLVPYASSLLRRRVNLPCWAIVGVLFLWWASRVYWRPVDYAALVGMRLKTIQKDYDATRNERDWDLHVGDVSLTRYTADLHAAWTSLFGAYDDQQVSRFSIAASGKSVSPVPWESINSRLSLSSYPSFGSSIPHRVWTTSSLPPSQYPSQFRYWAQNDPR